MKRVIKKIAKILFALLFVYGLKVFVLQIYFIPSSSMMPNLFQGDYIWAYPLSYGFKMPFMKSYGLTWSSPQHGDIVIFKRSDRETDTDYIKRVIGIPGDRIEINGNEVKLNGKILERQLVKVIGRQDENPCLAKTDPVLSNYPLWRKSKDYIHYEEKVASRQWMILQAKMIFNKTQENKEPLTFLIPPQSYFVMGDNRDGSRDSREFGLVSFDDIEAQAKRILFSFAKGQATCQSLSQGQWYRIGRRLDFNY